MDTKKKALFRVDASAEIGSGHVMRCLTLAERLKKKNYRSVFVTREHPGHLGELIKTKGFDVALLPKPLLSSELDNLDHSHWLGSTMAQDAHDVIKVSLNRLFDLTVVDHYGIDHRWESEIRKVSDKIFVIDDLADRKHDCDFLLDQNYFELAEQRYSPLVSPSCQLFLGPKYALLREEFYSKSLKRQVRNKIEKILIFYGGSDPSGETVKALLALDQIRDRSFELFVVLGLSNTRAEVIAKFCTTNFHKCQIFVNTNNIAELMDEADLSLGAGGATTWERCYMGLPTIVTIIAKNQKDIITQLRGKRVLFEAGEKKEVSTNLLYRKVNEILKTANISEYSYSCFNLMGFQSDLSKKL